MINSESPNPFLKRISDGDLTLMLGIRSHRTTEVVRLAAATGHHAVMVDLEHSTMSTDQAAQMCAVAADLGLTPLVRVPEREYGNIGRLLDGGAHGIIFPRIETVEEAITASRACRFPPRGQRSAVSTVPQMGMRPTRAADLAPMLDELTIVQMLIETPEGVANADAIAGCRRGRQSLYRRERSDAGTRDTRLVFGPRFLEAGRRPSPQHAVITRSRSKSAAWPDLAIVESFVQSRGERVDDDRNRLGSLVRRG